MADPSLLPPSGHDARSLERSTAEERRVASDFVDANTTRAPVRPQANNHSYFRGSLDVLPPGQDTAIAPSPDLCRQFSDEDYQELEGQTDTLVALLNGLDTQTPQMSTLLALAQLVETFFRCGPNTAAYVFKNLHKCLQDKTQKTCAQATYENMPSDVQAEIILRDRGVTWKCCRPVATLLMLFAASNDTKSMQNALQHFQSPYAGGGATVRIDEPSAAFSQAFGEAKNAAIKEGQTTVFAVTYLDLHTVLTAPGSHCILSHCFAMGVGPEGVMIWQAWGHEILQVGDYGLVDYIKDGYARLRDWSEADQFVRGFEKLVSLKGVWNAKCNKLYKKLFLVDINKICGPNGTQLPVPLKVKPWVHIYVTKNVTHKNVMKFDWSTY